MLSIVLHKNQEYDAKNYSKPIERFFFKYYPKNDLVFAFLF